MATEGTDVNPFYSLTERSFVVVIVVVVQVYIFFISLDKYTKNYLKNEVLEKARVTHSDCKQSIDCWKGEGWKTDCKEAEGAS